MNMFKPVIQAMCVPIISLVDMMRSRNKALSKGKNFKVLHFVPSRGRFQNPFDELSVQVTICLHKLPIHACKWDRITDKQMDEQTEPPFRTGNENKMFKSRLELSLS